MGDNFNALIQYGIAMTQTSGANYGFPVSTQPTNSASAIKPTNMGIQQAVMLKEPVVKTTNAIVNFAVSMLAFAGLATYAF